MNPCAHPLSRHVHLVFLLTVLFVSQGCYHYRVTVPQPNPATEYEQRTAHVLFWGLLQQDTPASDCVSNALDEVMATTNLGYLLISVATLGIWVPMQVKWRCGKEPLQEGDPIGYWQKQTGFDERAETHRADDLLRRILISGHGVRSAGNDKNALHLLRSAPRTQRLGKA